jgi:hypothetical protein
VVDGRQPSGAGSGRASQAGRLAVRRGRSLQGRRLGRGERPSRAAVLRAPRGRARAATRTCASRSGASSTSWRDLPATGGRFALSGHISRQAGDGWTSIARLVDCRNARQVWAEELRGDGAETESHDEVSRRIAARVASDTESSRAHCGRSAEATRRPSRRLRRDPAFLRVLLNRDASEFGLALESLQRVVGADPECALAVGAAQPPLRGELRV